MHRRGAGLWRRAGVDRADSQIVSGHGFAIQLLRCLDVTGLRIDLERLAMIAADDGVRELIVLRLDVLVDRANGDDTSAMDGTLRHAGIVKALLKLGRIVAVLNGDDHLRLISVVAANTATVLRHHRQHHSILRLAIEPTRHPNDAGFRTDGEAAIVGRAHEEIVHAAVLARVLIGRLDQTDRRANVGALRHVHVEYRLNKLGIELVHASDAYYHGRETDHLRIRVWIGRDNVEIVLVHLLVIEASVRGDLACFLADVEVILAATTEDLILHYSVLGRVDVLGDHLEVRRK